MTKKQFSFIGRIQEKLATSGPARNPIATGPVDPTAQKQADWLVEGIRRLARQFSVMADEAGLGGTNPGNLGDPPQDTALLLGYKLTLAALRRRDTSPDRDVVSKVRTRMLGELSNPAPVSGSESAATPHRLLAAADSDVAASVIRFEAGLPSPLAPFFGDLAPTFGGPCSPEVLQDRYGKIVRHLYDGLQKKLDHRERASASRLTRYAGAGG